MATQKLTAFELELIALALKLVSSDPGYEHSTRQIAARLVVQFQMAKSGQLKS